MNEIKVGDIEYRVIPAEWRIQDSEDKKKHVVGYAAVFNKLSEVLWDFREQIAPGAFSATLKKDDVRALFNHDPNYVLGRNKAKTLKLSEDENGLVTDIDPPDNQWARDLSVSIARGDINQMSFGFQVLKDSWEHKKGQPSVRTLLEVKLFDVSVVTFPAYPQTSAGVRDYLSAIKAERELGAERDLKGSVSRLMKSKLNYGYPINKNEQEK